MKFIEMEIWIEYLYELFNPSIRTEIPFTGRQQQGKCIFLEGKYDTREY